MKQVNAAGAVEGLTSDPTTILVDIRNRSEIKEQGTPNLASTRKKAILLPFTQVQRLLPKMFPSLSCKHGVQRCIVLCLPYFIQSTPLMLGDPANDLTKKANHLFLTSY